MTMRNCSKCLNNSWKYVVVEGIVTATCDICGSEVQFETRNYKRGDKVDNEGDKCRKCQTPVVYREFLFKRKKLKKNYYYTGSFYCPNCKTFYFSDKFKIVNK